MGHPFMPWQRLVADVAGEIDPDTGFPAYREILVTIMRQSGKTALVWAAVAERNLMWGRPTRVAYTAQTGLDGRQKFTQEIWPDWFQHSGLAPMIKRPYMAADNTGLVWENGSRVSVLSVGEESGHGKTLDMAVIDEAFADEDNRREQALLPTMATRPNAQVWNTSTAGTAKSTYLRRKIESGRAAVNADRREGIAYFEWSVPDDEDIDSPDVWARYMPAYGITQSRQTLQHMRDTMKEGEFRRAYCNQWTETEERVIPAEWWQTVSRPGVEVDRGSAVFAVDARSDRSAAAIVAADDQGRCELVAAGAGVGWLVPWFEDETRRRFRVVVDKSGPVANVGDRLRAAGVRVEYEGSDTLKKAAVGFYDAVADQQDISVRRDEMFDDAVAHATRRHVGDQWVWSRDIAGGEILSALSLARWVARKPRYVRPSVTTV